MKFGSLEEQMYILACAFKEHGSVFLPVFISPLGPEAADAYEAAGLQARYLDLSKVSFTTFRQLVQLIDQQKIELVHWNFYSPLNKYIWYLTMFRPRLQHYMTDHNSRPYGINHSLGQTKKIIKKVLLSRYRKVLCVSDFVLECLNSEGTWSNLSRCTHFINTERFKSDEEMQSRIRKELDCEGEFVVLVVANLIEAKGVDVVLKALALISEGVIVWIVGDGNDAVRLKELCSSLGLEAKVRFLGLQRRVEAYMQAADCLVCPSIWREAAGLVILEGLGCGLPVIGSAVGGIPEFIEDGETGFLFGVGDYQQLAEKIYFLQNNPEACAEMGKSARQEAVRRFSVGVRIGEYLDMYREDTTMQLV